MSLVKWTFIGLLALPAAELVVFILVAMTIGWLRAFVLFVATSLIGVMVLKRTGRTERDRFRAALASRGSGALHLESPQIAAMIGGILLVFPGFITDIAGAVLLLPWARRWAGAAVARLFSQNAPSRSPPSPPNRSVIDLEPDQWHQVPDGTIDDKSGPKQRP